MQSSSPISPNMSSTMKMSSTPPAIPPRASSLKQRHSIRLFTPTDPTAPKPKRKKLVRKHSSQPAFEILNPKPVPRPSSSEAQRNAPKTDEQDDTSPTTKPTTRTSTRLQPTRPIPAPLTLTRPSPPPLLPELDFGSPTTSPTSTLFDPSTHQPTPTAQITISILPRPPPLTSAAPTNPSPTTTPTYRCDIHASHGASHTAIEHACQSLVLAAGGRLLDSYFYPGGFLYSLPAGAAEPIGSGEVEGAGARIEVRSWVPFAVARFDGLRMHPPGGRLGGEVVGVGESWERFGEYGRGERVGEKDERSEKGAEGDDAATTPREGVRRSVLGFDGAALTSMRSLRRLKCRSSRDMELGAGEVKVSSPTTVVQSPREKGDHRFTVMSYASDSGDSDESGNEEWESVRSELDN